MQNSNSKISLNRTGLDSFVHSKLFCYLAPFTLLSVYLVYIIAADKMEWMDGYYLLHYLFNYDRGFLSRGFVGEVISWFTDTVTPGMIKTVMISGSVLLLVAASLCIGAVLSKTRDDPEIHFAASAIIIFLCFAPFTFSKYFADMEYDKLFWALALFAVFLSQKKLGIWFVPAVCVIATLINPLFLFGSMLLVSIILLHKCYESGFAAKNIIICALSYISMFAIGAYGVSSLAVPDFANEQEMAEYFFSRYSETVSAETINGVAENLLFDLFEKKDGAFFKKLFEIYFLGWDRGKIVIANTLLFVLPVISLLTAFWVKVIKEEKEKFRKFIFFLCIATVPVTVFFIVFAAWSSSRYFAYNYIVQLGLILYFLADKNEAVIAVTGKVTAFCKKHIVVTASFVAYLAIFFNKVY